MNVRNLALYISFLISLNGQSMSAYSGNDHQALMKEMSNMAMKSAQKAVDLSVQEGAKGGGLAMQLLHLGSLQLRDKQTDAALKTFERALKEVDSSKEEGIGGLAVDIHICIADCYKDKNEFDTAQKHLQSALQFVVTAPHPESEQMKVLDQLAANALLAQKYEEAESYLEKRHQLYKKLFSEYDDDAGVNRSLLAEIKRKQGKKQEAEALFKHVLAECPDSITDLRRYATLLRETNRAAEADSLERKANELQQHSENLSLNAFAGMMGMQAHQQSAENSDWGQELKAARRCSKER